MTMSCAEGLVWESVEEGIGWKEEGKASTATRTVKNPLSLNFHSGPASTSTQAQPQLQQLDFHSGPASTSTQAQPPPKFVLDLLRRWAFLSGRWKQR